MKISEDKDYRL